MWKAAQSSTINAPIDKVWKVLVTPSEWPKMDPTHYKQVDYPNSTLIVGSKGKIKAENSPAITFKVAAVDEAQHEFVTHSGIPAGKLIITRRLTPASDGVQLDQEVEATGPFSKLFAKLFFEKQIKGSLLAQHAAIKAYVET